MGTKQDSIATYADKSHFGNRSYVLFPDNIHVKVNSPFIANVEVSIRLSDLSPDYAKIEMFSPFLWIGGVVMLIGWVSYGVITEIVETNANNSNINFLLALGFVGLFVFLVGLRKQRFVRFQTRAGVASLDVFAHGPRKKEFQPFVDVLQEQIQKHP